MWLKQENQQCEICHRWRRTALCAQSVIWIVAFQNFAQEHSKSDLPSLILYRLVESLRVHVLLCYVHCICVWVTFPEVVALWCYLKLCFPIWTKILSILFNVQKLVIVWASFFKIPLYLGFYFWDFFVCSFVRLFLFLQCCIFQSMLGAK